MTIGEPCSKEFGSIADQFRKFIYIKWSGKSSGLRSLSSAVVVAKDMFKFLMSLATFSTSRTDCTNCQLLYLDTQHHILSSRLTLVERYS